jgi:hypothetical protein
MHPELRAATATRGMSASVFEGRCPKSQPQRHAIKIAMDSAEHCRMQSEECRRLLALAQNEAEASSLTCLSRTWLMIVGQADRCVEVMTKEAAQKK